VCTVLIDQSHVIQLLQTRGMTREAEKAEQILHVQVDTDRDADLLHNLGVDPDS
jgi:hypothetical protein